MAGVAASSSRKASGSPPRAPAYTSGPAEPRQSHPEGPGAGRVPVFKQACAYKETELTCEATRRPTSSGIYNYPLKQPQTKARFVNNRLMCWPDSHLLGQISSGRRQKWRGPAADPAGLAPHGTSPQSKAPMSTARGVGAGRSERGHAKSWKLFCARETLLRRCSGKLASLQKERGREARGVHAHFQSRCWEGTRSSRSSAAAGSPGLAPWAGSTQSPRPHGASGRSRPAQPPSLETARDSGH